GLRGVAVHAELFGDPGRGEGGVVVQELRDARREHVARNLVADARRAAGATAGPGAGGRGVVPYDVAGPVLASADTHHVLAHRRVFLAAVPGMQRNSAERSGLLALQQVFVIVRRRQFRDGAPGEVGIDL